MVSQRVKKNIFYGMVFTIMGIFIYWIMRVKTTPSIVSKQNFTSSSDKLMWDTTNIWTANINQNVVSKFDNNGTLITNFNVNGRPINVLPIGSSVWVSNYAERTISKINVNDGNGITITVGSGPLGMAFDGVNVWVCNSADGTCSVVNQGSNTVATTIKVGKNPSNVLFDGSNIWVCCTGSTEVWLLDPMNMIVSNAFNTISPPVQSAVVNGYVYTLLTDEQTRSSSIIRINTSGIEARYKPDIGYCNCMISDDKYLYIGSMFGGVYIFNVTTGKIETMFNTGMYVASIQVIGNRIFVFDQNKNQIAVFSKIGNPCEIGKSTC
jgi:YVTN family beta-propeller protein